MNFHKLLTQPVTLLLPAGNYSKSTEGLSAGFYKPFSIGMQGDIAFEDVVQEQKLINFKSGTVNTVIEKFKDFFSEAIVKKYKDLGNTHKMGIILYGPTGTGKTSCAQLIMNQMVTDYKAVCLDATDISVKFLIRVVSEVRRYTPDSPIIVFMDEFDSISGDERLLPFLDGTSSVDKCLFIGCTNHLDKIPERIVNRKGRIRHTFEIKSLPHAVYKEYLSSVPGLSSELLSEFAYKALEANLTIDQLKSAVTDYYIEGMTIEQAIEEAKNLIKFEGA